MTNIFRQIDSKIQADRLWTNSRAAANITYPKGGLSYFADSFVVAESSVLRIKLSAEKPAHRQSANRIKPFKLAVKTRFEQQIFRIFALSVMLIYSNVIFGQNNYDTCTIDTLEIKEIYLKKYVEIKISEAIFCIDYNYFLNSLKDWTKSMKAYKKNPNEGEVRDLKRVIYVSDSIYGKVKHQKKKAIAVSLIPILELDFTTAFLRIPEAIEFGKCIINDLNGKSIKYVINKKCYKGGDNSFILLVFFYLPGDNYYFATRIYGIR